MMIVRRSMSCGMIAFLVTAAAANAQWVDFVDETVTRLNTGTVPANDGEEKDVAVGDFNKDGWTDAIVVRKVPFSNAGPRIDMLLMNENGVLINRTATFAPDFAVTLTDARDIIIDDFDGDTWPDFIIANTFGQQPRIYMNLGEDVGGNWQGFADESATRLPAAITPGGPLQFCAVWSGDVTGDTVPDVYFSNYAGTTDVLLINDGTGFFTDDTAARLNSATFGDYANVGFGTSAEIVDIDNDGDNDIVKISTLFSVAPWNNRGVFILYNDGTGFFNTRPFQELFLGDMYMFTLCDLTNDGMLDAFGQRDSQDTWSLTSAVTPDGPITIAQQQLTASARTSGFGGNVRSVDIDNDGDLDIGVSAVDTDIANCGGGQATEFTLIRNDGFASGQLSDPYNGTTLNWHKRSYDAAFLDIDNDGLADILLANCTGYSVHMQVCTNAIFVPGDADNNQAVDLNDIAAVLFGFGNTGVPPFTGGDVLGDGNVGLDDLAEVLFRFGQGCGI